jgi:hypothetical protein
VILFFIFMKAWFALAIKLNNCIMSRADVWLLCNFNLNSNHLSRASMPSEPVPPPIYSQDDPEETVGQLNGSSAVSHCGTQILIIPTTDAINFQKGYVGAEGERAAIEGELQIKGAEPGQWDKVFVIIIYCANCQTLK